MTLVLGNPAAQWTEDSSAAATAARLVLHEESTNVFVLSASLSEDASFDPSGGDVIITKTPSAPMRCAYIPPTGDATIY